MFICVNVIDQKVRQQSPTQWESLAFERCQIARASAIFLYFLVTVVPKLAAISIIFKINGT